jgi:DNA-binding NarL/FixJ family response regulator
MDTKTSIILADNQDITRAGLRTLIAALPDALTTLEAADKESLRGLLSRLDGRVVVIIDYSLFDLRSIEELSVMAHRFPQARWLLFCNELTEGFVRHASLWDEVSIVFKDCRSDEIVAGLKAAMSGGRYLCRQATDMIGASSQLRDDSVPLTASEIEVLKLIAHGLSVKDIAERRSSSVHTITTHKKNIFRKLAVNNVYEATKYALRTGLVELVEYYI